MGFFFWLCSFLMPEQVNGSSLLLWRPGNPRKISFPNVLRRSIFVNSWSYVSFIFGQVSKENPSPPWAVEFLTRSPQTPASHLSLNMDCRKFVLLCAGLLSVGLAENRETKSQDDDHYKEGDSYFSTRYESHPHTCRKPGNCEVLYNSGSEIKLCKCCYSSWTYNSLVLTVIQAQVYWNKCI